MLSSVLSMPELSKDSTGRAYGSSCAEAVHAASAQQTVAPVHSAMIKSPGISVSGFHTPNPNYLCLLSCKNFSYCQHRKCTLARVEDFAQKQTEVTRVWV